MGESIGLPKVDPDIEMTREQKVRTNAVNLATQFLTWRMRNGAPVQEQPRLSQVADVSKRIETYILTGEMPLDNIEEQR